jgi:AcrR family transcriptional regulator
MKISKVKQKEIKARLLKIAIDLISKNGYKKTSMSKIAKEGKIAEATIYNYFPAKEYILYEYFFDLQVQTKEKLLENDEFSNFTLKEQLQFLFETQLTLLGDNRTFVLNIYDEIFYQNFNHPQLEKGNNELLSIVDELLDMAVEVDEIEPLPFSSTLLKLFLDYYFGLIYYWINDESENFENTTIMIDKSLNIVYSLLQSGLINKIQDLVSFVIKTHILNTLKPNKIFSKRTFGKNNG